MKIRTINFPLKASIGEVLVEKLEEKENEEMGVGPERKSAWKRITSIENLRKGWIKKHPDRPASENPFKIKDEDWKEAQEEFSKRSSEAGIELPAQLSGDKLPKIPQKRRRTIGAKAKTKRRVHCPHCGILLAKLSLGPHIKKSCKALNLKPNPTPKVNQVDEYFDTKEQRPKVILVMNGEGKKAFLIEGNDQREVELIEVKI